MKNIFTKVDSHSRYESASLLIMNPPALFSMKTNLLVSFEIFNGLKQGILVKACSIGIRKNTLFVCQSLDGKPGYTLIHVHLRLEFLLCST